MVLELNQIAPQSLKDAAAANAGPHVQVDSKIIAPVIPLPIFPEQWPVSAYSIDTVSKTTSLGLIVPSVARFAAWVSKGDAVFPGGPIVVPISASILATIGALGPSRISGLADPAQLWQDEVGVTTLSTAAETTTDSDGITHLVARCVAGSVRIGIGPASIPIVQDVRAMDNTINGPEVLFAGRILVTD